MDRHHRERLYRQAAEMSSIAGLLIEAAASHDVRALESALRNLRQSQREVELVLANVHPRNPYGYGYSNYNSAKFDERDFAEEFFRKYGTWNGGPKPGPHTTAERPFDRAMKERRLKSIAGYGPGDTKSPMGEIFRTAQRKSHPDAGGSDELFKEVTALGIALGLCDKTGKPTPAGASA
jgi:hypothetical protein